MEINRQTYVEKLVRHKHNGLVKVVTGLRRCGKSYLLFNLFKRHLLSDGVKALPQGTFLEGLHQGHL